MSHYPELAPLATPQDVGIRDRVLVTAICGQCGQLITITFTSSGARISHPNGCQHPATTIAAITWPSFRALPREAE